jgi:hypothetical protein
MRYEILLLGEPCWKVSLVVDFLLNLSTLAYGCSSTYIHNKATGPEGGSEWVGEFRVRGNGKPAALCVLDQGRQPSPYVPRQFLWAPPCHLWGHTQDSGRAAWGCWFPCVLCSKCGWLYHRESVLAGLSHWVFYIVLILSSIITAGLSFKDIIIFTFFHFCALFHKAVSMLFCLYTIFHCIFTYRLFMNLLRGVESTQMH